MKNIDIEVQQDHLERLIKDEPVKALAEVIWNAMDADATEIHVEIEEGSLTKLNAIRVIDNGSGIPFDKAEHLFSSLGDSWKAKTDKTAAGRAVHGEKGHGRFKAFSIGDRVSWNTFSQHQGENVNYAISGRRSSCKTISIGDPVTKAGKGTTVEISEIGKDYRIRTKHGADEKIRDIFALYLYQYETVKLIYDGTNIDAKESISHFATYPINIELENGEKHEAELSVVEWEKKVERKLMLCFSKHFPFYEMSPGIQARGFNFTSYLSSPHFKVLADENREELVELDPAGEALINATKDQLRTHFKNRESERSKSKIEEWKDAEIYPYDGEPSDIIETNERSIFNVVAVNLTDYSSDFEKSTPETQKLIFQLVKSAVETDPKTLPKILQHVLNLPKNKLEELSVLLQKTTLTSIINSARAVTDRLDFLKALQIIIYDPKSKKQLLERTQLHRILAEHTWIFGEQFNLLNDDEDLTTVLKKHLSQIDKDRDELAVDDPVLDADGKARVVDLMLSRRVPLPNDEEREHLVVELKRPSQKVNRDALSQISNYAHMVANDERFKGTHTKWSFVVISNEVDDYVASKAKQRDRPRGLVEDIEEPSIKIWVKTWAQILQESEGRLKFFKQRLEYSANEPEALRYLQEMNEKYLSASVLEKIEDLEAEAPEVESEEGETGE